jgi:hypothetical protein
MLSIAWCMEMKGKGPGGDVWGKACAGVAVLECWNEKIGQRVGILIQNSQY